MKSSWVWVAAVTVSFFWASTVFGIALELANREVGAWWIVLPFGLLPFVAAAILLRRRPERAPVAQDPESAIGGKGADATAQALVEDLTPRELEVLGLLEEGSTNRQIAQRLYVSPATVKSHVNAICRKLQASNRTQAVAVARKRGLLVD